MNVQSSAENTVNLGEVTVSTSSSSINVIFQCVYPDSITVTSDKFAVTSAAVSGTHTGSGSLTDGFSLIVGDGSNADIELGQMLDVAVTWDLTLSDVNFYLRTCYLAQGESTVNVIKDGCLSKTLKVSYTSQVQNNVSFEMVTFSIDGENSNDQFIGCSIKLCMQNCDKPTSDDQCPADEAYAYTIAGYTN